MDEGCLPVKSPWLCSVTNCPEVAPPTASFTSINSEGNAPMAVPTGQSVQDNSSIEVFYSQVTLGCFKLAMAANEHRQTINSPSGVAQKVKLNYVI